MCMLAIHTIPAVSVAHADESNKSVAVGQPAPELDLAKLLQAPQEEFDGLSSLKDNVVILEFWATWCGPCVKSIPHMNELAEKLADKPVRFISITAEDETDIAKFLKKKSMRSWIGLDLEKRSNRAYGVQSIPFTVLIDRAGKIAGITRPDQVTEQHVLDVLEGKPVKFKPDIAILLDEYIEYASTEEPSPYTRLFDLSIEPSRDTGGMRMSGFPGSLDGKRVALRYLLSNAYGVRPNRVVGSIPILEQPFDVRCFSVMLSQARAAEILQDALCASLGIKTQIESRELDAYVLTIPDKVGDGLKPGTGEGGFSTGNAGKTIKSQNWPISRLAETLETILNEPVLDETGLKGRFDYELKFEAEGFEGVKSSLEKELGIRMIRAKRPVEFLVVEYAD